MKNSRKLGLAAFVAVALAPVGGRGDAASNATTERQAAPEADALVLRTLGIAATPLDQESRLVAVPPFPGKPPLPQRQARAG